MLSDCQEKIHCKTQKTNGLRASENWKSICSTYDDEFIAVKDNNIIAHDATLDVVLLKYEKDPEVQLEYIPPKDVDMIL